MVYGYCRISTPKQNMERQERNIKSVYPDATIVKEVYTGTKVLGREKLDRLLKKVQFGDTIVFDSVSRMSRNAEEGVALYKELFDRGIELVFLKEPHINTSTYKRAVENQLQVEFTSGDRATDDFFKGIMDVLNQFVLALAEKQIVLAFEQSEKEVQDLHQRTKEGIETARLNGKQIGQVAGRKLNVKKALPAKEIIKKHNKAFGGTLSNKETWKLAGITKVTFYKYKKELLQEMDVEEK